MPKPMIGDVLDRPVDRRIRRSFYTDFHNAMHKIEITPTVVPDIAQAKPKALGDDLMENLKKAMQGAGGGGGGADTLDTKKALPSNLAWRG